MANKIKSNLWPALKVNKTLSELSNSSIDLLFVNKWDANAKISLKYIQDRVVLYKCSIRNYLNREKLYNTLVSSKRLNIFIVPFTTMTYITLIPKRALNATLNSHKIQTLNPQRTNSKIMPSKQSAQIDRNSSKLFHHERRRNNKWIAHFITHGRRKIFIWRNFINGKA